MKYSGMSIGDIYKTLSSAKRTREIWGGSYIFSYLMKSIIKELLKNGVKKEDFITPFINDELLEEKTKIGKFHDRLIYKGEIKLLKEAISKVIDDFAEMLSKDLEISKQKAFEFVKNYFKFYLVEKEIEEDSKIFPIKLVNDWLNIKELFYEVKNYKKNYLFSWLHLSTKKNTLFNEIEQFNRFKSLPEIALSDINDKEIKKKLQSFNSKDEIEIFDEIQEKYPLKPFHKYIAIVHADGDNLSKSLNEVTDIKEANEEVRNISKKLFDFSNIATKKIKDFDGELIYAGGDDLLFFAPIIKNKKSVFELLNEIKKEYKKLNIKNSTISFGVSITYYKFPLSEALEESRELLFFKAKEPKDATAFKVIKHSGQSFESVILHKDYDKFLGMLNYTLDEKNEDEFLHSLYSKIYLYKEVIKNTDINRLNYFFENNFNENYDKYKNFFKKVIDYYVSVKDIDILYSTLRLMKFLKGDK